MSFKPTILHEYQNGNYTVQILNDGTKIRKTNDDRFIAMFPETIDMKITNYCDMGCEFCHENSNKNGKHANIEDIISTLKSLPAGVEIAIGGGNPLSHPDLMELCARLKHIGMIPNITINSIHLQDISQQLILINLISVGLIHGIGVSYSREKKNYLEGYSTNVVCHLIAGVHNVQNIEHALNLYGKILILGYKFFRKGENYFKKHTMDITRNIDEIKREIPNILRRRNGIISFDNLAIEQLDIRGKLSDEEWETFYMGDEGKFSMYFDAVEGEFALSSIHEIRSKSNKVNILEFFQNGGIK